LRPEIAALQEAMGGSFMRPPTGEELDQMKSMVEQEIKRWSEVVAQARIPQQ